MATDAIRDVMKANGLVTGEEGTFNVLKSANLTEAERGDVLNYLPGGVLLSHQNAKGFVRGQRVEVNGSPLPLESANRFTAFHTTTIKLAKGDAIRITQNGFTADGTHLPNNGAVCRASCDSPNALSSDID